MPLGPDQELLHVVFVLVVASFATGLAVGQEGEFITVGLCVFSVQQTQHNLC
jgi:H+/Cl- antiporter ClcA